MNITQPDNVGSLTLSFVHYASLILNKATE